MTYHDFFLFAKSGVGVASTWCIRPAGLMFATPVLWEHKTLKQYWVLFLWKTTIFKYFDITFWVGLLCSKFKQNTLSDSDTSLFSSPFFANILGKYEYSCAPAKDTWYHRNVSLRRAFFWFGVCSRTELFTNLCFSGFKGNQHSIQRYKMRFKSEDKDYYFCF